MLELEKLDSRIGWKDLWMNIAKEVAKRSKDPHTQVGAVIVKDNHILGIGYNADPRKFRLRFDWHTEEKYTYVIHAELNAVANACAIGTNIAGADIYVTMSPCKDCIKLLIQHQIKKVYYLEEYKDFVISKHIAKFSPIKLKKFKYFKKF